jgi:hypothetical protein
MTACAVVAEPEKKSSMIEFSLVEVLTISNKSSFDFGKSKNFSKPIFDNKSVPYVFALYLLLIQFVVIGEPLVILYFSKI